MTIARLIEGRGADLVSCTIATPVRDAVNLLAERRIGALPVFDGDSIVGIFSERDVIYQLRNFGTAMLDRPVGDVMTAPAITVDPQTGVLEALGMMTRRRVRHLPVVQGSAVVGFVSIGDLVKYRIDHIEAEAEAMRNYIQTA
jgi:CBS domain-containing protein